MNKTQKRIIGDIGEDSACTYLKKKGFSVLERNYLKKWGEIDIVAKKDKILHFVEVKSVSKSMSYWDTDRSGYRPEDNMHPWKMKRLTNTIMTYLLEKNISDEVVWQIDLVVVYIDTEKRNSRVYMIENIIL